jgi:hypothetical protein
MKLKKNKSYQKGGVYESTASITGIDVEELEGILQAAALCNEKAQQVDRIHAQELLVALNNLEEGEKIELQ